MDQDVREYFEQMAAMMARELAGEFPRIKGRFDGVDSRFDRVEARLESHDRRLDRLEAQYHDLRHEMRSGFTSVRESIDALTLRVEVLE